MSWKVRTGTIFLASVLLLGCTSSRTTNVDEVYSPEELQIIIDRYLEEKRDILGTIVRLDIHDHESYGMARGYFDKSHTTPIEITNKFIIGSITKIFTAVLVLQLVEEGKIRIQDPLIDYLPSDLAGILEGIEYGKDITVQQTLSHRSGIADVTGDPEFRMNLLAERNKKWGTLEILELVKQNKKPEFKPGEDFDYNNINYLLLGAVIEHVSRRSYRVSLENNIFNRIRLENTFLSEGTFGSGREGIAHGYYRIDNRLYDGQDISAEWALAAGGIISSADDLIKFYGALRSGLLFRSEETYKQMITPVGNNELYGLGLEVVNDPEIGSYYGHGGSFSNTRTVLTHFPEHQITISVCLTIEGRSMAQPADLVRMIVRDILNDHSLHESNNNPPKRNILSEQSEVTENRDVPVRGNWDFSLEEAWNISRIGDHSLEMPGVPIVDDDGRIYLLAQESGEICVLSPDGDAMYSFGGYGDGPQFEYAYRLYVTEEKIHVLDIRSNGEKIKTFDKNGDYIDRFGVERGISPRQFIDDDRYMAVRSTSNVEMNAAYESLEILSLSGKENSPLTLFPAEEKLTASTEMTIGQCHLMLDDVEIFPSLVTYFDGDALFFGRNDRYLIKKMDLDGKEELAFMINGRKRKPLPPNYGEDKIRGMGKVCGMEMPEEMREQLVSGFPDRQVFFTEIITDEKGLIYVFLPDVMHPEKQDIDIFSPEGSYLYRAVIELPNGYRKSRPFVIKGKYLYALVKGEEGKHKIIKYGITLPNW